MHDIVYKRRAARVLRRLPRDLARRILERLEKLAEDPSASVNDVVPLQSRPGYRLRVGSWRVIFRIEREEVVILVIDISPRRDAYK